MSRRPGVAIRAVTLALLATTAACALPPEMAGPGGPPQGTGPDVLPPPGYGTLRQSEVSIALTSGPLQLMVTPLDESVTRMTAPDTYRRLRGMVDAHGEGSVETARLFLVSFYSEQADTRFVPEEVQLLARGQRVRPTAITPVTPSWGERRLAQRATEMAVYAFPSTVDLESDLTLVYGLEQSGAWTTILPRIQAERARARGRAGIGGS